MADKHWTDAIHGVAAFQEGDDERAQIQHCESFYDQIARLNNEKFALQSQNAEMAAREAVKDAALKKAEDWIRWTPAFTCGDCGVHDIMAEIQAAQATPSPQAARLLADAERYRKLRNQEVEANFPRHGVFIGRIPENLVITGEDADRAIDALTGNTSTKTGGGKPPSGDDRCPECGDAPTHQTPDGTYWDGNAHYWRADKAAKPTVSVTTGEDGKANPTSKESAG